MGPVEAELVRRLTASFAPIELEIENESHRHAGHAGDDGSGETHFRVHLTSPNFVGLSRLERQRRVHAVLADLLATRIHALALRCRAPGEDG
ncbi:MAG: BolA family transcriptional regulator [Sphingomonadaceae bacterium]|uniref:BolA family protein n=1 Tax=Thermaurantiacus sp. TaxID=2820283 RepID=UPI00298F258E|nr:BolA family protein [Thermaurantiacus sp.]MCS6987315.1 BolA family transcriptional regulator [Sphingomonadaceae bacterium]MDW8414536.1 BolA family protein [Thermaurantiacus sp.]